MKGDDDGAGATMMMIRVMMMSMRVMIRMMTGIITIIVASSALPMLPHKR